MELHAIGIDRKRATHPQGFVIGVREHGHQSRSPHDFCDPFGRIGCRANSRRSLEQTQLVIRYRPAAKSPAQSRADARQVVPTVP
jgi:hypothetical protein